MTSEIASRGSGSDDDGFGGSLGAGRLLRGQMLKWDAQEGWRDRDGASPPEQLLVLQIDEALQRWRDNKPEVIREKPLPDEEDLNAAIPIAEWEKDMNGQPRPPWAHVVVVYFLDPHAGGFLTFISGTTGAHIGVEALRESVVSMRMLRRAKVTPIVRLGDRPMKTRFGMKSRPHFEPVSWREPDGDAAIAQAPEPPRIDPPASQPERGTMTITSGKPKAPVNIPAATPAAKPAKGKGEAAPSTKPPLDDGLEDLPFA